MSVVYNTNVLNSRLQVVLSAIDAGAGSGILTIGTTGMAVILATIILAKPCGVVAAGVLTLLGVPLTTGAVSDGVAAAAQITDSTGTVIISGLTVGTVGTDMIISQTTVSHGDVISLTAGTITGN